MGKWNRVKWSYSNYYCLVEYSKYICNRIVSSKGWVVVFNQKLSSSLIKEPALNHSPLPRPFSHSCYSFISFIFVSIYLTIQWRKESRKKVDFWHLLLLERRRNGVSATFIGRRRWDKLKWLKFPYFYFGNLNNPNLFGLPKFGLLWQNRSDSN